jgi:putative oxidoreductase
VAWGITIVEIAGGITLASGRLVLPIATWFVLEHVMGIILVHAPRGWFTVGHQVGGAEFSVLLIICFLLTASTARREPQRARE